MLAITLSGNLMWIGFPSGSAVKNLPAVQETTCNPGQEDPWSGRSPLKEQIATHSSIPAWEIPWSEEPDGLQSMGSQEPNII